MTCGSKHNLNLSPKDSGDRRFATPEDLPHEMLEKIIFQLAHPYDHLSFAKCCSTVYRAYTARTYRLLCFKQEFTRSIKDAKVISWHHLFWSVLGHADTCDKVYCRQFAIPAKNSQIDLAQLLEVGESSFPPKTTPRVLYVHLKQLAKKDLREILHTPYLSVPLGSKMLDYLCKGLEDTRSLITFWKDEIRQINGSLVSHPPLGRALRCQPPDTTLTLDLEIELVSQDTATGAASNTCIEFENKVGITVFEVMQHLHQCLDNNLPKKLREEYPKHLQKTKTWFDHLKLADKPQKSRVVITIEKVDLTRSADGEDLVLKLYLRRTTF
ncbi:uncharacterized protein I303_106151 [Kwoniella dejecticola CBS 10117]|uniref:Uncharacterized protein n=1 Tax=Kwoniella dejecticola CBS 10117 TaxID=1296121 RepID=A0A1A6A1E7_9TREE|nr:uncharacterized protein I303_06169 [Kwoniella dejecticola CBS 10117]OBR83884.1 hypothetical protein I303_06169 [Kwoniella dejecticola CBS 10117]